MDKAYEILKNEGLEGKTIGVNSTAQAFNVLDIGKNCGVTFVNGKPLLEEVRIIKTHEELENMRLSARVADSAFEKACAMIRPGITEAEVRGRHSRYYGGTGRLQLRLHSCFRTQQRLIHTTTALTGSYRKGTA